ncbi:MAG: NAD+ kinase [Salinivirgaceae bacterium]|nr:MAG: NAD+ kinase [Salinivirgaceae bacterium]
MHPEINSIINWWTLSFSIAGGLSLFLFGMMLMTNALKSIAGGQLNSVLGKMTQNRVTSLAAGAGITAIIQSSSITTVLIVGFVSAGLMEFSKTLGIILGANIGTTITAQIIAFKVTDAALFIVALGYLITAISKKKKIKDFGTIFLGLGLIFLGMNIMTQATMPLRNYEPFINIMRESTLPVYGILMGAVFTALVQSSSATTGVIIVLASQGLLSLENSLALIIGANIGTCVTAFIAAIGKPRAALQVATAHILFKTFAALVFVFLIPELANLVKSISSNDLGRQVANAHTIFNVSSAMVFIFFTKSIAKGIKKILPDKTYTSEEIPLLDEYYLEHPNLALDMVEKSINDMGQDLLEIANKSVEIAITGNADELKKLRDQDKLLDSGHEKILHYISQIQQLELRESELIRIRRQTDIANLFENAGDLYTTNIVEAAEHRLEKSFTVSNETKKMLTDLFHYANNTVSKAVLAYQYRNKNIASTVLESKGEFSKKHAKVHKHIYHRLSEADENRVSIIRFEVELLEVARRLHSLARRISRRTLRSIQSGYKN